MGELHNFIYKMLIKKKDYKGLLYEQEGLFLYQVHLNTLKISA